MGCSSVYRAIRIPNISLKTKSLKIIKSIVLLDHSSKKKLKKKRRKIKTFLADFQARHVLTCCIYVNFSLCLFYEKKEKSLK